MTTHVIIGTSNWRDYSFPAPIAALLWREVVGYEPYLLLVGSDADWERPKRNQAVIAFLTEHKIQWRQIPQAEGYEVHVTAQNCRQHSAAMSWIHPDDWVMLSDADLWPLRRDFYHQHEETDHKFVFYYANGDHYQSYPTCHMTARASTWRELMNLEPNDDVTGQMKRNLDAHLKPKMDGKSPSAASWQAWMNDQWMFTEWVKKMPWYPSQCYNIERRGHPPVDRLDRGCWPANTFPISDYVDCHILRPADQPENWPRLMPILESLLPDHVLSIRKFRREFVDGY